MSNEEKPVDPPADGAQPADPPKKDEENKDDGKSKLGVPAMPEMPKMPFGGDSDGSWVSAETEEIYGDCCCCHCVCANNKTQDLKCFGCLPIKCGIVGIGIFTLCLAAWQISYNFFLILNDLVVWWYPVVTLSLLIPLYIAANFFVVWFTKDQLSTRSKLIAACILIIVALSLVAVWNVVYFVWLYKGDTVYIGWGGPGEYKKFQKKFYIFVCLFDTAILLVFYSYFLCVVSNYKNALRRELKPEEKEERKKAKAKEEEEAKKAKEEAEKKK